MKEVPDFRRKSLKDEDHMAMCMNGPPLEYKTFFSTARKIEIYTKSYQQIQIEILL
jgi:hypothetical protein